eukprot:1845286-Alexandrium_andersonii.AAC.1
MRNPPIRNPRNVRGHWHERAQHIPVLVPPPPASNTEAQANLTWRGGGLASVWPRLAYLARI